MNSSKLIRTWNSLSFEEKKEFWTYVQSPFCNPNPGLLELLSYIQSIKRSEQASKLTKEAVFKKVYPKRKFDPAYLRKQSSLLFKLLRSFLIFKQHQSEKISNDIALLKQYRSRKLDRLFENEFKQLKATLDEYPVPDRNYFYWKYQLAQEEDLFFGGLQTRRYDQSLQEKVDMLDHYYLLIKLQESCEMLNRSRIVEGEYSLNFMGPILEYLEQNPVFKSSPVLQLYLNIYYFLLHPEEQQYFLDFKVLLQKYGEQLNRLDRQDVYQYAKNYCIRAINTGNRDFLQELFELYKIQLEQESGSLKSEDYKNIVTVGLQLQAFDWTYAFIHDKKSWLSPEHQEAAFQYNLAAYFLQKGEIDTAIQKLASVRFSDPYYEISGKLLLLNAYYQQEAYQAYLNLVDTFKLYVQRNKVIAPSYRKSILNFLTQAKKITRLKESKPYLKKVEFESKWSKLQSRIKDLSPVVNKAWLLRALQAIQ